MSGREHSGTGWHRAIGRLPAGLRSAWLVLAVSLSVSIWVGYFALRGDRRNEETEFNARVHDVSQLIQQRMLAYEHVLQGAAGLFAASQSVERDEWHRYVSRLDIGKFYPGIRGIAYAPRVARAEKELHVRQVRKEGFPSYSIFPEGGRDEYTPVVYVEPFAGRNLNAFGYDMFSDPVRRAAMERARDTGDAAVSGKIALLPSSGEAAETGFLFYLPVYRNGWPAATVEQRRAALQGYVVSPFGMKDLMAGILGREHSGLEIELYDGSGVSPAAALYDSAPGHSRPPRFSSRAGLDVAGHRWTLVVSALPDTGRGIGRYHPLIIFGFGVTISLLLFAVFRSMAESRGRALTLARSMSADYAKSAERYRKLFDEATDAIAVADAASGEILDVNRAMEQLSGWSRSELIGKSQKMLHPSEPGAVSGSFVQHRSSREGQVIETQLVTRDGRIRDVEIKASSLELNGRKALMGFFRDITERRQYEQELFKSNELLERIFANIRMLIAYMDADFNFIRVNHAYAEADGHDPDYFVGKNHFELFPNRENERIFREVVASGKPYTVYARPFVYEHNPERGVTYWDWNVQPVKDRDGRVAGLVLSLLDRTGEKKSEERLRLFGRALEASVNAIMIVDALRPEFPISFVNPAFSAITGYGAEEVLGRNPRFLQGSDQEQPELENIRRALRERRNGQAVLRNYRKDGSMFWNELFVSPVWDEAGAVTHFIGVARDITRRKSYEAEMERLTNFDTLTGLPNRSLLHDRLEQAIVHAHRDAGIVAVAMVDLDGFKAVNDSLGHHVGDLMLHEVAQRLSECAREGDTVGRQGGDEFIIVMPELTKEEDAAVIAEKLLKVFSTPVRCDEHELFITASIGIAMYPRDGTDADSMLKHGDIALHRAKERERNGYQFYSPEMNRRVSECLSIGNGLHRALERDEFVLHYQPQLDLRSGEIVGVEALLRWQSSEAGGMVPPAQFIPVAEECGLIVPIGNWVLRQACLAARGWHDRGFGITVAVNLSARQLREPGLVETVRNALDESGLEARYLELELTESILIDQAEFVFGVLQQLRDMGVQLSLDDFGTGYSSLSYLKRFPITRLKIDQSFIRNVVDDPEDAAIVGAIISMAHNLKLRVIAEGVEAAGQRDFLRSRQCDEVQGYYFGRPVPAEEITDLLRQGMQP